MGVYYMGDVRELPQGMKEEVEKFLQLGVPDCAQPDASAPAPVSHFVTLGTSQEGAARLTVISLLKGPSLEGLFMQCNRQSQKVKNLLACDAAEIAITNGAGYVILSCKAEVLTDAQSKAGKWEGWMAEYHPDGPESPDYVLLRFLPQRIRAIF